MEVSSESVTVRSLVDTVQASICQVQGAEKPRPGALVVTSAEVELHVVMDAALGGGLDVRVPVIGAHLRIGGRRVRHRMHTVRVALLPGSGASGGLAHGAGDEELVLALRAVRDLMDPNPQAAHAWSVSDGTVQVSFAVTEQGSISVGLDSDRSDEHVHSLRLELRPAS
ncbi:trypco2 family protein [Streptacidiphilus anmyonensis]|uniref:trypco2 family protein n=1 Tax=Streptacidiphilus anmyonensis TaxID=405782 RepID=UPI0005AB17EE|nr:trypco2 family protein [Streptacidiphilus anmyonensis]